MPITPSTTEIVIPPTEAKVANKYWITSLAIWSPTVNAPARVECHLLPYNEQTGEAFPTLARSFTIDDIFPVAATDADVAMAMGAIFNAIDKLAKQQGVI